MMSPIFEVRVTCIRMRFSPYSLHHTYESMIRTMWVALAMLAGTLACGANSGSTSLNAFVPACGGLAGEFVYSSHALKVWVKKRTIALRTDHGEVSFSYGQQENRSLARGLRPLGGQ